MIIRATLVVVLIHLNILAFGQRLGKETNYWPICDNIAISFDSVSFTVDSNTLSLNKWVRPSSMCDYDGKPLLYTNGRYIFNGQNQLLNNGNLTVNTTDLETNTLLVPKPYSDSIFYLFKKRFSNFQQILEYSIINTKGNGGQGTVTLKNQFLVDSVTRTLSAFVSRSDSSIYIATRILGTELLFFRLSKDSLFHSPVVFNMPLVDTAINVLDNEALEFSPDGTKMILGARISSMSGYIFTSDTTFFLPVSNPIKICRYDSMNNSVPYGIDMKFTPSGSNIVYPDWDFSISQYPIQLVHTEVNQYDSLSINSSTMVFDSILDIVSSISGDSFEFHLPHCQVTPNGNVVMIHPYIKKNNALRWTYLNEIRNPESAASVYLERKIDTFPNYVDYLPNFLSAYFDSTHYYPCDSFQVSNQCLNEYTLFEAPLCDSFALYEWDFGDSNVPDSLNFSTERQPGHIYSQNGNYDVTLTIRTMLYTRVLNQTITISNRIVDTTYIGKDTTICDGDSVILTIQNNTNLDHSKLWSDSTFNVTSVFYDNGFIWGQVGNSCNVQRDSIYLSVIQFFNQPFPEDTFICGTEPIVLNSGNPGSLSVWNDSEVDSQFVVTESGEVKLYLSNECFVTVFRIYVYFESENGGFTGVNIFTPNSDMTNDYFKIYDSQTSDFELKIFNRWGRLVYLNTNPKKYWDAFGSPDGIYFYNLRYRNCKNEVIEHIGTVQVAR